MMIVNALTRHDPVLMRLRAAILGKHGDRLERVVLFGSRTRSDFRADSDCDVAVFLRDMGALSDELGPLSEFTAGILAETGAVISAKPFRAGSYTNDLPLMHEIGRDGIEL